MKRILIFSLAYYPKHIGGAEVAVKEITDRISPETYEFHMVCNRYDSTLPTVEKVGNVLVHRIGITKKDPDMADLRTVPLHVNKLLFQYTAYRKARQLHKKYTYDGIWAIMAHACGVPAGMFKKEFPAVAYILTLQEGDPLEYIERKMRIFGRRFHEGFTRANTIQAISTFLGNWSRKMGFTGKLEIIPNAVDIQHFSQPYTEDELDAVRKELGKKEGDVLLVTTSRLVHKNGIDVVIRAVATLHERVHFIIFGTGPDEKKLRSLAHKLHLSERVHFKGHIDHHDMPKYLKACDIFIRPSRSEGMGNSFIEAMASGLPVIATQEGGIADFLFDKQRNSDNETTGWAVDKDNPEQIAEAVKDILRNPEEVKSVIKTSQQMAIEKYDWDSIAHDMKTRVFDTSLGS